MLMHRTKNRPTTAQWFRAAGYTYGPGIGRKVVKVFLLVVATAWSAVCWSCILAFPSIAIACGILGFPGLVLLLLIVFGLVWPMALRLILK